MIAVVELDFRAQLMFRFMAKRVRGEAHLKGSDHIVMGDFSKREDRLKARHGIYLGA